MITTLSIIIWSIIVLAIIGGGMYSLFHKINGIISIDYKYCINFNKISYKNTNYPIIKLRIKNKYKYFLLDSGANINVLSSEALKKIYDKNENLHIVGNNSVVGIGDTKNISNPIIQETISIGRDKFEEQFTILDSWEDTRKIMSDTAGIEIVGLLGSEFFSKAKWVLDFDSLVVWVKK